MSHLFHLGSGGKPRTLVMASTGESLPSSLRPYQWEGVHFLLDKGSVLLADEMGLGKTVQVAVALSLRLRKSPHRRSLVVVPASLRAKLGPRTRPLGTRPKRRRGEGWIRR